MEHIKSCSSYALVTLYASISPLMLAFKTNCTLVPIPIIVEPLFSYTFQCWVQNHSGMGNFCMISKRKSTIVLV